MSIKIKYTLNDICDNMRALQESSLVLASIVSLNNELMQRLRYDYDAVSNITSIDNYAGMLPNGLGGIYRNDYTYDKLYRLGSSEGWWDGDRYLHYDMDMSYLKNGRLQRKSLVTETWIDGNPTPINYDNRYHYDENQQPNTVRGIYGSHHHEMQWDAKGNMVFHRNHYAGYDRRLCWDEQNRLMGVKDDGSLSFYMYDAGGDRTYKLAQDLHRQNQSGRWRVYHNMLKPTLYASPYVVCGSAGYTKHYYAESERVASRIGGGGLHDLDEIVDEKMFHDHRNRANMLFQRVQECMEAAMETEESPLRHLYDWSDINEDETRCYWYHTDHLGSSSWITFSDGRAVQHLHYLPWGEDLVRQRHTNYHARYTFSGKEKDTETGYSYFGARYYSSELSIWLSVDPQASKYPSLSPYVYCANNPIKLVDPNGEEIGWIQDNEGNVFWDENTNSIEDFKCNYDGKTGYSYVSDNDNFRSYTLPNGDGKVLVNEWVEGNVTDGCSTPIIELEFSPSDKNCSSGWIQTYYSNVPDADSHNYGYLLPGSNLENRLDFQTIDKTSTTVPYWNPAKESTKLQDMPRRAYNEGAARAVIWGAQSSILVNGRRSVTISWGFSINSNNSGTFYSPRIEKKPNTFHLNAIQLMR